MATKSAAAADPAAGSGDHAPAWQTLSAAAASARLKVHPDTGLSPQEAAHRLARHGPNAIREKPPRPLWRMFVDQFSDFMIVILIAAAVVSGLVGDLKDTLAIVVIVLLNAVIGFVQEVRAQRAMASLRQMAATGALVLRGGQRMQIPAAELVPGDMVLPQAMRRHWTPSAPPGGGGGVP